LEGLYQQEGIKTKSIILCVQNPNKKHHTAREKVVHSHSKDTQHQKRSWEQTSVSRFRQRRTWYEGGL